MIKISHVMTIYTIKNYFVYVYNFVLYVYNIIIIKIIMKYFIYVLQARFIQSNLPAIHLFFTINEFDVM